MELAPELRPHLSVAGLAAVVVAAAAIFQAELLGRGVSKVVAGDTGALAGMVTALVFVALAKGIAAALTEKSSGRTLELVRRRLRGLLLEHAARDRRPAESGLASRCANVATTGLDELEPYVRGYLPSLAAAMVVPGVALLWILRVDWASAAIVAITVPLVPVFMVLIGRATAVRTRRRWALMQRLSGHFLDVMDGLPTLRMFGRDRSAIESVRQASDRYRRTTLETLRVAFVSAMALETIATLSVALVAVSLGLRLAGGGMELGDALVVLLLAPECYFPLRRLAAAFHSARSGTDAALDIGNLLGREAVAPGGRTAPKTGGLKLSGVGLDRPDRGTILNNFDLSISPGSVTVVLGPSGAGKSTIVDLCRGRLSPDRGTLTVGNTDLVDLDPEDWARYLAVIPQRPSPIGGTVADEMDLGGRLDLAIVVGALKDVGLADRIEAEVAQLSGGELRRLQVARALAAARGGGARFILADEPTAHLDDAWSEEVRALLAKAARGSVAVLVVTHDQGFRLVADQVTELDSAVMEGPDPVWLHRSDAGLQRPDLPVQGGGISGPSLRNLLEAVGPVRGALGRAAVLGFLAEACTVGLAAVSAWLIVKASERPPLAELAVAVTAVRTFGIGKGAFRYVERLATHDAGLRMVTELRANLIARLRLIAPAGLPGWSQGDVLRRVVADVDRILDAATRLLVPLIAMGSTAILAITLTLVINPGTGTTLALVVLALLVVISVAGNWTETRIGPPLLEARGELAGSVLSYCQNVDQLLAFQGAVRAREKIEEVGVRIDSWERRRSAHRAVRAALVSAAPGLTVASLTLPVGWALPGLSGPAVGIALLLPLALMDLVTSVAEATAGWPEISAAGARISALLDLDATPTGYGPVANVLPHAKLQDAAARWPGDTKDAFTHLDLDLPPRSRLSITGPNGSGKSTLAALMVAFLTPSDGRYLLDGLDVSEIDPVSVRTRVVWIPQNPWIAATTVGENLKIARPGATESEMLEALDAVGLSDWVLATAHGLSTQVGRGGASMSGGEAQRLALARALLADHGVSILDEPTAHLDAATANRVTTGLTSMLRGRTVIWIAHDEAPPGFQPYSMMSDAERGNVRA